MAKKLAFLKISSMEHQTLSSNEEDNASSDDKEEKENVHHEEQPKECRHIIFLNELNVCST
jgi:hypothetical protein